VLVKIKLKENRFKNLAIPIPFGIQQSINDSPDNYT